MPARVRPSSARPLARSRFGPTRFICQGAGRKIFQLSARTRYGCPWRHGSGELAVGAVGSRNRCGDRDAEFRASHNSPDAGVPEADPEGTGELAPVDFENPAAE